MIVGKQHVPMKLAVPFNFGQLLDFQESVASVQILFQTDPVSLKGLLIETSVKSGALDVHLFFFERWKARIEFLASIHGNLRVPPLCHPPKK